MAWQTPKTDWAPADGVGVDDLNRIEGNVSFLNQKLSNVKSYIQGFQINTSADIYFTISDGSCVSESGNYNISLFSDLRKTLSSWSVGYDGGSLAPSLTITPYTWYYIFAILNPNTGVVDLQIDNTVGGVNISASGFTEKRRVGCVKTNGDSEFYTMDSIGDEYFIDFPTSERSCNLSSALDPLGGAGLTLENPTYGFLIPQGLGLYTNMIVKNNGASNIFVGSPGLGRGVGFVPVGGIVGMNILSAVGGVFNNIRISSDSNIDTDIEVVSYIDDRRRNIFGNIAY